MLWPKIHMGSSAIPKYPEYSLWFGKEMDILQSEAVDIEASKVINLYIYIHIHIYI